MTDDVVRSTRPVVWPDLVKLLTHSSGPRRSAGTEPTGQVGGQDSPWLTVNEAAAYVGFCDKTIRRACQLGKLKCARVGRRIRIRREWLDAWVMTHSE